MRLRLLVLAFGLAACSTVEAPLRTSAMGVVLEATPLRVESGGTVELVLINGSDWVVEMGVFGCAVVQRWDGAAWQSLEADNARGCILPLITVVPGEDYEGRFLLDVAPGRVRLAHRFNFRGGSTRSLVTPAIRVTG